MSPIHSLHAAPSRNGRSIYPTSVSTLHPAYAPIEKRPLLTHDGMKSRGYTVRIEDEKENTGWREVGIVSEDYLLVPNSDVRDMALDIAVRTGHHFEISRTLFDGKRFALAVVFPLALSVEVRKGDAISVGMLFRNSYDGSERLSASLFVYRLACLNGMIAPQLFGRVRFKHDQKARGWEEEVERVMSVLSESREGLDRFASAASKLASTELTTDHLKALRRGGLSDLPLTLWAKVVDNALMKQEPTLWGLLNAGTAVLWHDEKQSVRDLSHNEVLTKALIGYAHRI